MAYWTFANANTLIIKVRKFDSGWFSVLNTDNKCNLFPNMG